MEIHCRRQLFQHAEKQWCSQGHAVEQLCKMKACQNHAEE